MAKLPSSFRKKNRTTRKFREMLANLPAEVLDLARDACLLFHKNPTHPGLRHHELQDRKKGSHFPGSFSVTITMSYRAIYLTQDGVNVWYWIGTHADYDGFTGKK